MSLCSLTYSTSKFSSVSYHVKLI